MIFSLSLFIYISIVSQKTNCIDGDTDRMLTCVRVCVCVRVCDRSLRCSLYSAGISETHPWHLHGHDFWIVGTYVGQYNSSLPLPEDGGGQYVRDVVNLVGGDNDNHEQEDFNAFADPDVCDTAYNGGSSYTVIRFVADNPGVWFLHCHIDYHLELGMAIVFYYRDIPETVPEPNLETLTICGDVTPEVIVNYKANQEGEGPAPEPDPPVPGPDVPAPGPDSPAPEPDVPAPGPDPPAPEPDAPVPEEDAPGPGPD